MTGLTVAQVLSQTFNGRVEWGVPGSYLKILSAAANLQLEAFKGGVLVLLAPTVKAGFYQRVEFDRIVVTNTGSQLTEILVAPDQGGSDAFTANSAITSPLVDEGGGSSVLVSQFGDAITAAGKSFITAYAVAAVAAQNSTGELFNPNASGVVLYVDRINVRGSAAVTSAAVGFCTTALATDLGTCPSKNQASAASLTHARSASQVGNPAGFTLLDQIDVPAGTNNSDRIYSPALRIPANCGLAVMNNTVNQAIAVQFQFREKAT